MYPNVENMIVVLKTKRMEIIRSIQVCLIWQINFDYKENGRKKSFSCKSQSQWGEHDYGALNKKNGDYYGMLVYLISCMNFDGKENLWKEKLFL